MPTASRLLIATVYAAALCATATLLPRYTLELITIAVLHKTVAYARNCLSD